MMNDHETGIAIIGMSGRFPGASTTQVFWDNLRSGTESISFFSDEEMLAAGVEVSLLTHPLLVKAGGTLEDIDLFDAHFFDYSPREAEFIDPQQRLFLECSWEALEASGYISENYDGSIGVYGSVSQNSYLSYKDFSGEKDDNGANFFQLGIGTEKDFVSTRVSYKLNLQGPSLTVQTACSSSLVAVHLACQSLHNGECDIAIAGGVSINSAQKAGYFYQEGGVLSPDGHCRTFDADANGTVAGYGVGVVVLKPLANAISDGDTIYAVIKGSAINNDGSQKIGFTAPSINGQARAIAEALAVANVNPETIGYVEAHGTATSLGDPIEVTSLTKAFCINTQATSFCALGSVKTNIGHLDVAAGVAGLIKVTLMLKHKIIPPSLHFKRPNPQIDFANSPFYVNTTTSPWKSGVHPRRAGVNSFGIGGTNVHVVIEESPVVTASETSQPWHLIVLSAKTPSALDAATVNLAQYLTQHPEFAIADVAYTLQNGRRTFNHRRMLVCQDVKDLCNQLETSDSRNMLSSFNETRDKSVVFLFPGQGSQYEGMGEELYQVDPTFRKYVDRCSKHLKPLLGIDLRDVLYRRGAANKEATEWLNQAPITQSALFVTEYALARLWMEWGIYPQAMIGHSTGEYVAACLAGVFSLEDALMLIAARGKLMQQVPPGAMLAVPLPYQEITPFLNDQVCLAAINHPRSCVVSGPFEAIDTIQKWLAERKMEGTYLKASHAFHSSMMEPILAAFVQQFEGIRLNAPKIPYISCITARWITESEATDPNYWTRHLRETVHFSEGVSELLKRPDQILVEVGPGHTLTHLVRRIVGERIKLDENHTGVVQTAEVPVFSSLRQELELLSDRASMLYALGKLWLAGMRIDWTNVYKRERRQRIPLPTYPFERQRYWIAPSLKQLSRSEAPPRGKNPNIQEWFYIPSWKCSMPPRRFQPGEIALQKMCWLVFVDEHGLGANIVRQLERESQDVISIQAGDEYKKLSEHSYILNIRCSNDYDLLLGELRSQSRQPRMMIHLWSMHSRQQMEPGTESFELALDEGYYSILHLIQALERNDFIRQDEFESERSLQIAAVTNDVLDVALHDVAFPEKATIIGPCIVAQQEYPVLTCRCIDIPFSPLETLQEAKLADQILAEILSHSSDLFVAYRGNRRWVRTFEPEKLREDATPFRQLRKEGVYLITGGLGGVGLLLADTLARQYKANFALVGRTGLPPKSVWQTWLAEHPDEDDVSRKIRKVQALEALGSEVLLAEADVSNEEQMQGVMTRIEEKFGVLHGVIHAAGIVTGPSLSSPISTTDRAISEIQFGPKVYGLYVLEKVLRGRKLDFCVLISSNAAILGGPGFAAYTTANLFMDAFAHHIGKTSETPWISTNWDGWWFDEKEHNNSEYMMTPGESTAAFVQVVCHATLEQVIISTENLFTRLATWIKREALPPEEATSTKQLYARPNLWNTYVSARSEVEERIAIIWEQVLGIERIGIHDNFFDLGGHSLLATQVISRIRASFQTDLPLRVLFEQPTVAQLAEPIQSDLEGRYEAVSPLIKPGRRPDQIPLSYAQQRLWFLDQWEPDSPLYNIPIAWHLTGPLQLEVLERSLREVVHRHEILRTNFPQEEGRPLQRIVDSPQTTLLLCDLSQLPLEQQQVHVRRCIQQESYRPFDLSRGPLLRMVILRQHSHEHILLVTMHHIISDGWSLGILFQELSQIYQAFIKKVPSPLPNLPFQYADYVLWQRQWLVDQRLQELQTYWKQQLQDLPELLELPTDHPRQAIQTFRGASVSLILPGELSKQLKKLSRSEGATLFMTLLAAFQVLLYRYSGQTDLAVGSPIANRTPHELEPLIGSFANTLILRARLDPRMPFRELLRQVREVTLQAYAHQDLPFEQLVELLQPTRSVSYSPLFQVFFELHNTPSTTLSLDTIVGEMVEIEQEVAQFDLTLALIEAEERLLGSIQYNIDLFEAETITRMVGHLQILLAAICAHPDCHLEELPLLHERERELILERWNDTRNDYPRDSCLHQCFEEQIIHTPEAIALVFEDHQLTCREVNRRANQLAHYLQRQGIGLERTVGVYLERSLEMVIALLAVLKAGGAYVPLDPTYPQDRLLYMLDNARVSLVLTQHKLARHLIEYQGQVVCVEDEERAPDQEGEKTPDSGVSPANIAYVIYTSGSTGRPKGVMVPHRSIVNFLTGMDKFIDNKETGVWLAVTSISFDISVLELFWTLTRGFRVVIQADRDGTPLFQKEMDRQEEKEIEFSLFYFANDTTASDENKYRLLVEGAKFADQHGFSAVWTPERHFHAFGGLYPNPSVTSAAIATVTERIKIRAGSVVLPLHNPIRIAEEWAVVDNLSKGRVGISFASGWHANDFVLAPEQYAARKAIMFRETEAVRKLWRGEEVSLKGGTGNTVEVRIFPHPIQPELPIWITAAGSPETFELAGEIGANLLTHLLGQSIEELAEKINRYRMSWRKHGHGPGDGHVTLMLHTFIGKDSVAVREKVREPFYNYLESSLGLIQNLAHSLGQDIDEKNLSKQDIDALLSHAFDRYYQTSGLLGTVSTSMEMVDRLKKIGVDELACLIDFGVDADDVLESLEELNELRLRANKRRSSDQIYYSIPEQISRQGVTHMQCTPSLASMLTKDPQALHALGLLKQFLLGGEKLPVSLVTLLKGTIGAEIRNMYGPTETTIWSSTQLVGEFRDEVAIGHPIANTQIYILDHLLQPVPICVPGEIYIGGEGLVRGYLGQPALVAERFLPDPLSKEPGARLYRTGDRAKYLPNGAINFLGRLDRQVKIRGYRIELGEIEAVLSQHPGVREAVVIAREDSSGDRHLAAYVVLEQGQSFSVNTIRAFLAEKLPEYMVPSACLILDAMPLTPNGKVNRKLLPKPDVSSYESEDIYVAPRTFEEEVLADLWAELLEFEQIGVYDNFFKIGGHSLLAMQLISRVRSMFNVNLPLLNFFETPTVAGVAQNIKEIRRGPGSQQAPLTPIVPLSHKTSAPLSFAQQRYWILDHLDPGNPASNVTIATRLTGGIDLSALERSLNEIVKRHSILRTTLVIKDGQPLQIVAPTLTLALPVLDLSTLPEVVRDEQVQNICISEAQRRFDLTGGILITAHLLRLAQYEHVMLLNLHHIITDGWSNEILIWEMKVLYDAFLIGKPSPLPELSIQYKDFVLWQHQRLRGEALEEEFSYWMRQLEGAPLVQTYLNGRTRSATLLGRPARAPLLFPKYLVEKLQALSQEEEVTLFMTLLAAFKIFLSRYTGQEDIIIGAPVALRPSPDVEGVVGLFNNTLILRTSLAGNPPFREFLKRVRKTLLEGYSHQDIPFEKLVEALKVGKNLHYHPLYQVLFVSENIPRKVQEFAEVRTERLNFDAQITVYDLVLSIEQKEYELTGSLNGNAALFNSNEVAQMCESFYTLLAGIVANPSLPIADLPF